MQSLIISSRQWRLTIFTVELCELCWGWSSCVRQLMQLQKFTTRVREPANKSTVSQRDLKCVDTRRFSPLMAVALSKRSNAVDAYCRARPSGLTVKSSLCVVLSRLSPLGLRKHALMMYLTVSLRCYGLIRRFLS